MIKTDDLILVCDVGGGTTDFSLIQVDDVDGDMVLKRIAVGNHLLVGGDNMDLSLSYAIYNRLAAQGTKLDGWQTLHEIKQLEPDVPVLLFSGFSPDVNFPEQLDKEACGFLQKPFNLVALSRAVAAALGNNK